MLLTLAIFIIVISLLVFVHEYGHFLTARRLGVAVEEFGFGFPPRIIGVRRGSTVYSINWIPFGGFVRLKGETPGTNADPDSFTSKSRGRRFAILAAGVVMNYVLAAILFTVGFSIGLPSAQDPSAPNPDLRNVRPQVVSLEDNSPATRAGIVVGDVMTHVNGIPITEATALKKIEDERGTEPLTITLLRGTRQLSVTVTPVRSDAGQVRIGVGILDVGTVAYRFPQSLGRGIAATANVTGQIFSSFGRLLRDLVVERQVSPDLAGPVGVVVLTGQAVRLGFGYLIQFVALLSTTLAVINFFPLPALDGGRALFVVIERLRGRAVDHRIESLVHAIGFYVLIALVLLISLRDVQRFGISSKLVEGIRNAFGT